MKKFFLGAAFLFVNLNNKIQSNNKLSSSSLPRAAICILEPSNSKASGVVLFTQEGLDKPTIIKGKFSGLNSNSKHGFHIHQYGDRSDGCNSAGPHFNPLGKPHGDPDDEDRHVGDLGNVQSNELGNALYARQDNQISLFGTYSVLGRSCVLHEAEDDLGRGNFEDSKTTGHSGKRIACGIIALCDPNKQI